MIDRVFDLTGIWDTLISSVPLWVIIIFLWKRHLKKSDQREKEINAALQSINGSIHDIELKLAGLGIDDVKKTIKDLEVFKIEKEQEVKAIWRAIDPTPRKSDL